MPIKYIVVDHKIIPKSTRQNKYQEIVDKAKLLVGSEALAIGEQTDVSLLSVMSLMRRSGYKTTLRTVNKIKTLYIEKAESKPKK